MRRFVLARNRLLVSRLTFPFGRSITLINDLDTPTPYRLQYRSLERLLERGCGETTARGPVGACRGGGGQERCKFPSEGPAGVHQQRQRFPERRERGGVAVDELAHGHALRFGGAGGLDGVGDHDRCARVVLGGGLCQGAL